MQPPEHQNTLLKLTKALFISGALNIFCVSFIVYLIFMDRPPTPYYELKPADKKDEQVPLALNQSNAELLRHFRALSREQLMLKLSDAQWVENGYSQRDLALACLVQFHYFDLEKALKASLQSLQRRTLAFGRFQDGTLAEVMLFPGLTEIQYEKIQDFAHKEKWPLTSKGLFLQMKESLKHKEKTEASLVDAFCLTPEFLAVDLLFKRASVPIEKSEVILILLEGNWEVISSFTEHQRALQDLSEAKRQQFLLDLIDQGSRAAAYILLKTDGRFAATKLDDLRVLQLLNLMKDKTDLAQKYAMVLLKSPRGDAVLKMAAQRLYEYAGEEPPQQLILHNAMARFVQNSLPVTSISPPSQKPLGIVPIQPKPQPVSPKVQSKYKSNNTSLRYYVVQEGDSLWKISRKYKANIDSIKTINHLQSDFLKPGTTLKIPILEDGSAA